MGDPPLKTRRQTSLLWCCTPIALIVCWAGLSTTAAAEVPPIAHVIVSYDASGSMLPKYIGDGTNGLLQDILLQLLYEPGEPDEAKFPGIRAHASRDFNPETMLPLVQGDSVVSLFSFAEKTTDHIEQQQPSPAEFRAALRFSFRGDTEMTAALRHAVVDLFGHANEYRAYWVHVSDGKDDPVDPTKQSDASDVFLRRKLNLLYVAEIPVPEGLPPVPGDKVPTTVVSVQIMEVSSKAPVPTPPTSVSAVPGPSEGTMTITWLTPSDFTTKIKVLLLDSGAEPEVIATATADKREVTVPFSPGQQLRLVAEFDKQPSSPVEFPIPGELRITPDPTPKPKDEDPAQGAPKKRESAPAIGTEPEVPIVEDTSPDSDSTTPVTTTKSVDTTNPTDTTNPEDTANPTGTTTSNTTSQGKGGGGALLLVIPLSVLLGVLGFFLRRARSVLAFALEQVRDGQRSEVYTLGPKQRVFLGMGAEAMRDSDLQWTTPDAPEFYVVARGGRLYLGQIDHGGDAPVAREELPVTVGESIQVLGRDGQSIELRIVAAEPASENMDTTGTPSQEGMWDDGND